MLGKLDEFLAMFNLQVFAHRRSGIALPVNEKTLERDWASVAFRFRPASCLVNVMHDKGENFAYLHNLQMFLDPGKSFLNRIKK